MTVALVQMQGMGNILGDIVHTTVKIATLPITLPISISKDIIVQGLGVAKGVLGDVKTLASALKPPPPPPPPVADYFGVGGPGASLAAIGSAGAATSSSKLPIIVGGVALVGLVMVAVLTRKKKGRRR
jgi:hypothetical protein